MPGDFDSEYLINEGFFTASDGSASSSFTTIANRDEQISIKANAIDTDGRASLGIFASMDLANPGGTGGGNIGGDVDYGADYVLLAIVIVIGVVAIIAIWFAPINIPPDIKIVLIGISASVIAVLALLISYG